MIKSFKQFISEAISNVDTPEFRQWFRNSKVVDSTGNPLIVYHGTDRDIKSFNPDAEPVNDDGYMGAGTYFHEDSRYANQYALMAADEHTTDDTEYHSVCDEREPYGNQNVYPVYLSVQKPYQGKTPEEMGLDREGILAWTEKIKSMGYDGVTNGYGEWCVFYPTQIKSIYNNGNFDPSNPVITEEVLRYVRNILMDNKHNKVVAEKARLLIRKLDPINLLEDILDNDLKCECGFDTMGESYELCPCCGKSFWEGKECYYKVDGHICSLDGEECEWLNEDECGKLDDTDI